MKKDRSFTCPFSFVTLSTSSQRSFLRFSGTFLEDFGKRTRLPLFIRFRRDHILFRLNDLYPNCFGYDFDLSFFTFPADKADLFSAWLFDDPESGLHLFSVIDPGNPRFLRAIAL